MRVRSQRNTDPQALSRAAAQRPGRATVALALLGVAALAILPATAADRVLSPSGSIHTVTVENRNGGIGLQPAGTKLVYRVHSALEESTQSTVIPGTDEPPIDAEPSILLSPITQRPVIVWTRNESTEAEIYFSFFNGSVWSVATQLTQNVTIDRHPQIFWGRSGYLHVIWTGATTLDGPLMYEAVLDSKGLIVVPPALVRSTAGAVVTTNAAAGPSLSPSDAMFLVDTSFKQTNRVTAQGGYDEPIPIHRRTDFMLPAGNPVESSRIEVVNERVLVMVRSGSRLFYSYASATSGWTPLRTITLDDTTDEGDAGILIKTMLQTLGAP